MVIDSIKQGNTIIEFDDEFIVENKLDIRNLEFEIFVSNALERITNQ